jgi:ABC-type glycerol-3-phosphate transport system permease component
MTVATHDWERPGPVRRNAGFVASAILAVFWLAPILILAMNAFKSKTEFLMTSSLMPPSSFSILANIQHAWTNGLSGGFFNSLLYGVAGSVGAVALASLAAFGIVRLKIPYALFWFLLIYSGTIFPFQMYLIPLFQAYLQTGLYDTQLGMICFYIAICIPFCTFVMRGFFLTVPWEIQEAASLDGASSWTIFWRIMFPMARAPVILLILIQFTWIWNDLLFGLVLSKSDTVRTVMVALVGMQGLYSAQDGPSVIAATLICSAPTLILFLGLQRYFVRGLTMGLSGR